MGIPILLAVGAACPTAPTEQAVSGEGTVASKEREAVPAPRPDEQNSAPAPTPDESDAKPPVWPPCTATSPSPGAEARAACLTPADVRAHLEFVARERVPGSPHWQAVQDRCAERFEHAGFEVERVPFDADDGGQILQGVNVIGTKRGLAHPEQIVVLGAHYEHISGCNGADDNGSGTAALLAIVDELSGLVPDRTLVVACWDQEETGLHGSRAHVESISRDAKQVVTAVVFDTMGVRDRRVDSQRLPPGLELVFADAAKAVAARQARGDFVAVLANPPAMAAAKRLSQLTPRGGVDAIALVLPAMLVGSDLAVDLHRSDHANFWARGWPALMLTDTADFRTPTYHCLGAPDDVSTVDIEFITGIAQAALVLAVEHTSSP